MMLRKGNMVENFQTWSHQGVYNIAFNHMKRPYNILDMKTLDELNYLLLMTLQIHNQTSKTSYYFEQK